MDQAQDDECDLAFAGDDPVLIRDYYNRELTDGDAPWLSEDMCIYIFDPSSRGDRYCANGVARDVLGVTVDTVQNSLQDVLRDENVGYIVPLGF